MNSAALAGEASAADATAYSIGQQLIVSAWNVALAVIVVSWVFGWSGGKQLVRTSYDEAKVKSKEMKERRRERRGTTEPPASP
jgi:di/tricarboxylate transporter